MAHARIFTDADLKRLRRIAELINGIVTSEASASSENGASAPRPKRKYKRRKPKAERAARKPKAVRRYRRDEAPAVEPQASEEVPF